MWIFIGVVLVCFFLVGLAGQAKENAVNRKIRIALEEDRRRHADQVKSDASRLAEHEAEINARLDARDEAFKHGILQGRKWLAEMLADAEYVRDRRVGAQLAAKKHPAKKAAEVVRAVSAEKRALKQEVVFLRYQLKSYEEYFPLLEEYRDLILDERIPLSADKDNSAEIQAADPSLQFLSLEEYNNLSTTERNQRALERYVAREKSNWEIGRLYERYLGFVRETRGWRVEFHGAMKGFEDFGRDLICTMGDTVEIVQAKCWSRTKTIHEKHVFQLYGTCVHFRLGHPGINVTPVFVATTGLSEAARWVANALGVRVEYMQLPKQYPMIKCNINPSTKERIYHLPFDQQYDRVVIGAVPGECYVETVQEAEKLGFRRAWKHVNWAT